MTIEAWRRHGDATAADRGDMTCIAGGARRPGPDSRRRRRTKRRGSFATGCSPLAGTNNARRGRHGGTAAAAAQA